MCIMYIFHAYYSIRDFDKAYYMRIPYVLAVHDFDNTYCRRINGVLAEIFEFSLNKASKVKTTSTPAELSQCRAFSNR